MVIQKMIIKLIKYNSKDHDNMIKLRNNILRKPLGLTFTLSDKNLEKEDFLIGAFQENILIGCGMLSKIDKTTLQLRQMAIDNSFQHKGIGYSIVQYAEKIAKEHNYKVIMMHARSTAIDFYKKLDYSIIGDEFIEIGIPHYIMEKNI